MSSTSLRKDQRRTYCAMSAINSKNTVGLDAVRGCGHISSPPILRNGRADARFLFFTRL